jgi:hypothetical protein
LGHRNFTDMLKIASEDIVKDLSKMEKTGKESVVLANLGNRLEQLIKRPQVFILLEI